MLWRRSLPKCDAQTTMQDPSHYARHPVPIMLDANAIKMQENKKTQKKTSKATQDCHARGPMKSFLLISSSSSQSMRCSILFAKISTPLSYSHLGVSAPLMPINLTNILILTFNLSRSFSLHFSGQLESFLRSSLFQSMVHGYAKVRDVGVGAGFVWE